MAPWAGWGAGPSGAGATGGPTRAFHAVAMGGCAVAAIALGVDGRLASAAVAAAAAVYFALRLLGGLGRRR